MSEPTIEIRRVQGEEMLETSMLLGRYAFTSSPGKPDVEGWRERLPFREEHHTLVLFADGEPRATAASIAMTQTVRGKVLSMGGIGGVSTHPLGRRQGYARQVLVQLTADMREQGHVVSSLVPFRESFYGRLGWAGFPVTRVIKFAPGNLQPLLRWDLPGSTTLHEDEAGWNASQAFLQRVQPDVHGMSLFGPNGSLGQFERDKHWVVLAHDGDEIVGTLRYTISGWRGELDADTFFASTAAGKYLLLRWLALHADQVVSVIMTLPPDVMPEMWLTDMDVEVHSRDIHNHPKPMGRIVDVARLSGIGAGDGAFTVRVEDPYGPWNNETFSFCGDGGRFRVERAESSAAGGTLSIAGLSSLVFNGDDPETYSYRGWGSFDAATVQGMRALFPPVWPYLHEDF